jgi:hypothetical protein
MSVSETKFSVLIEWIRENGGYISDSLSILCDKNGRSVVANCEIDEGEELFKIPESVLMGSNETYVRERWEGSNITNETVHVVTLLVEKEKPDSFYKPYIDFLPSREEFDEHPVIQRMNTDKCDFIVTPLWNICSETVTFIKNEYSKVSSLNDETPLLENLVFEEFCWGYIVYLTRAWSEHGLVPFADLLNHSEAANSIEEDCSMKSPNVIKKGNNVYNNYRQTNPWKLVSSFSFLSETFSHNVYIPINILDTSDALKRYGIYILKHCGVSDEDTYFNNDGPNKTFMELLRVMNLKVYDSVLLSSGFSSPFTLSNEVSSVRNMLKIIYTYSYTHRLNDKPSIEEKRENSENWLVKYAATITISEYNVMEKCYEKMLTDWELQILPESMKPSVVNALELYSC